MPFESLSKLEFNPDNLVHIPDDPLAFRPVTDIFPDSALEPITLNNPMKFEAEFTSTINASVLKELAGIFSQPEPFYMELNHYRLEQARKHRKKRINKKWAKRYGYHEVPCRYRIENCYIQHNRFNDFEIVSKPPVLVKGE